MNLEKVLNEYNVPFCLPGEHHHVRDGWVGVHCPWCPAPIGGKGEYRLGIELVSGRVNCWICGRHSLAEVLVKFGKTSFKTVKQSLAAINFKASPMMEARKFASKTILPKGVGPLLPCHKKYLIGRGFDPDQLAAIWKIGGIGLEAEYRWRIFIPIQIDGQTVSWTTRSIVDTGRRYITAKPEMSAMPIADLVYGIDMVRDYIIIHEGPADVWRMGPGAVATLGTITTPKKVGFLRRFPLRIVCFDNSAPAQKAARRLAEELSLFPGRTLNVNLDAEDPGSASQEEINTFRKTLLGSHHAY